MIIPAGDIKDMAIPWLFQDLRAEKTTGTVTLTRDTEVKNVYFRSGEVIYASSNLDADQLGSSLIRAGKLAQERHAAAEEIVRKTGKPLGAVLVERGFIAPSDLIAGAKLQVKEIVFSLFQWRDGSYRFDGGPLPLAQIVPLQMNTGSLLYEGLRDLDWKIVRKSLPPLKTSLRQAKDFASLLPGIELDRDQRAILSLIDGNRSIEELCALSDLGDFSTLKAIYLLIALRLAEQTGPKTDKENKQPIGANSSEQHEVPDEKEVTVTRQMVERAFNSLAAQDYFEMLGVARSATPQEIKKSYFRLAKLYHPDRHVNSGLSDMKAMLETIFVNINEAYTILSVEATRDQYTLALTRGIKKYREGERAAGQQQDSQKGNAAAQFNEGLKRYRIKNFWGAEEAFQWAMRLDPSNPEYVFHMGMALAHIPRRYHDAEEHFLKAIKMAPSKIEYYLELGSMYAKSGLKVKALSAYQDALKRAPNSEKIKQAIASVGGQPK